MKLKLKFNSDRAINFQFGNVGVLVGTEPTEVDDVYAKSLLKQYPDWVALVKEKKAAAADVVAE